MITILNNFVKTVGRKSTAKRMILLSSLVCGLTLTAQGQPEEMSYLYDKYSLKHYATSQQAAGPDFAMAGTIFDYNGIPGNNGIHLLVGPSPISTSVVYDDKDFDERLVGLHYNSPDNIVMVTTLGDYTGRGPGNGIQIIQHPSCERQYIFAPADFDYWPMGSLMDVEADMLYICGYVTPKQSGGEQPDYSTPKKAFVIRYELSANNVADLKVYDWIMTSPLGRDYDMAHRMKFINERKHLWVGGTCNGQKGSAMMNMAIDPMSLLPVMDEPLNTVLAAEDHVAASFDISDNLNGKGSSYIFGNYFYAQSLGRSMDPQPSNYSITSVDASSLQPVPGAVSHAYFSAFNNAWGINIVKGNKDNSVILSGYQNAEKCHSPLPSSIDNVNPFLTEMELTTTSGNLGVGFLQWTTMLSKEGTGVVAATTNNFYQLGGGLSNLVFGPITTVSDNSGNGEIVLNAPVWNTPTNMDLNIKYIRTDQYLYPNCEVSNCETHYEWVDVSTSERVEADKFDYAKVELSICKEYLDPNAKLNCEAADYFKGANTASVTKVGNAVDVLVATVYPNPAHDKIQVKLNGTPDASAGVTVQLTDITGKQLSVLYNGNASGIAASMQLPGQLPNGLYTITVVYNGAKLKAVPLVIN